MKYRTLLVLLLSFVAGTMLARPDAEGYANPVLPGFHPDPSVCRVGDTFYLVNSSFQYFPGVPIYESRDLVHWTQVGNVLTRPSQLPLEGTTSWTGIYAPTIRHHRGVFYMVTTNVSHGGNFYVTASSPEGPWSEPIALEQQGIDPSFYFEDDKCYFVSNPDGHITLCEIDPATGKQLTSSKAIWNGTGGRYPEGPHIYRKDGYYYLLISEGGTELAHKLTIARSRNIYGPYEACPDNPILTHCRMQAQGNQIQGTGHGDFVQAADGTWWMVFLAYRFYGGQYHHLGRETFLAPVEWAEGEWPVIHEGKPVETWMEVKTLPQTQAKRPERKDWDFSLPLHPRWLHLQNPIPGNYDVARGRLRMQGHGTLTENNRPTYLGCRQTSPTIRLEAVADVSELGAVDSRAGISVYQSNDCHADLFFENNEVVLRLRLKSVESILGRVPWEGRHTKVRFEVTSDGNRYYFFAGEGSGRTEVGGLETSLLSTEVGGGFTGVTLGMFAEGGGWAAFERFFVEDL